MFPTFLLHVSCTRPGLKPHCVSGIILSDRGRGRFRRTYLQIKKNVNIHSTKYLVATYDDNSGNIAAINYYLPLGPMSAWLCHCSMAATVFVQPLDLIKNRMQLSGEFSAKSLCDAILLV